jgi:uncharacterized membrane protein
MTTYSNHTALKDRALQTLAGRWDKALGFFFLYFFISIALACVPVIGSFIGLFISGPLAIGACLFTLRLSKNQPAATRNLFEGFNTFSSAVSASILTGLFTFLWLLLLIVPGIIAALSYSQTFYILAENPSMGGMEAINKSKEMMQGHKARFFGIILSFAGWFLLALLSVGIGFLWLIPYYHLTLTKFYEELRGEQNESTVELNMPDILY